MPSFAAQAAYVVATIAAATVIYVLAGTFHSFIGELAVFLGLAAGLFAFLVSMGRSTPPAAAAPAQAALSRT